VKTTSYTKDSLISSLLEKGCILDDAITVFNKQTSKCNKVQFNSFRDAQGAINLSKRHRIYANGKRINKRIGKKDIRPVRSYRCEECGFWHLTSKPDFK
jgi:hypothetical protein